MFKFTQLQKSLAYNLQLQDGIVHACVCCVLPTQLAQGHFHSLYEVKADR